MARRWRLQPARFDDQREAEFGLYRAISEVFNRFCEFVWPYCGVPGRYAAQAAEGKLVWDPADQAEFDRAVRWFIDSLVGKVRDRDAFRDPSTAMIDVHNPIYDGEPILQGQLRTSFEVGIGRAVQLVGDDAPALLGQRNAEAQREFLGIAFDRLSEGARLKIGDVLNGTPKQRQSVRDLLLTAMNEGQSLLKTARQLRGLFREIDGYDWQRLARTETSFALNAGAQAEYLERGYRIPATDTGAAIELPPYHPNCLLPGTRVAAENIAGYLRGFYRGPSVELALSNGHRLAVTANHLILTPDGFARAATLHEGGHVICTTGSEWVSGANPDDDNVLPLAEDMFDAALKAFGVSPASVPLAAEDVHGDGAFIDGKVDIVSANGFLPGAYDPALIEQFLDLQFEGGTSNALFLASGGYRTPMFLAMALTADCRVSRPDHPLSRLRTHIVSDKLLRFLFGADANAGIYQNAPNDTAVKMVGLRQVLNAFSGEIALCQIVGVRHFDFSGHVYDLQTFSSLYIANTVVTSNCVCGTTILPHAGYIVPDVAATACEACQAARIAAEMVLAEKIGVADLTFAE